MFKPIPLGACLLFMAALIGAGPASARTAGLSVQVVVSQHTGTDSSTVSLLRTIWSGEIDSEGEKHDSVKPSHHHEGEDEDERERHDAPAPTPEPSTILTFGTALAIGGGVFLLGRLRKERK